MNTPIIVIEWIGGNCPVQAEGTVNGLPFYFRARGDAWRMEIGPAQSNPAAADESPNRAQQLPVWEYHEKYGEWPAAGWMTEDEALAFIDKAARLYMEQQTAEQATPEASLRVTPTETTNA